MDIKNWFGWFLLIGGFVLLFYNTFFVIESLSDLAFVLLGNLEALLIILGISLIDRGKKEK